MTLYHWIGYMLLICIITYLGVGNILYRMELKSLQKHAIQNVMLSKYLGRYGKQVKEYERVFKNYQNFVIRLLQKINFCRMASEAGLDMKANRNDVLRRMRNTCSQIPELEGGFEKGPGVQYEKLSLPQLEKGAKEELKVAMEDKNKGKETSGFAKEPIESKDKGETIKNKPSTANALNVGVKG